MCICVCVGIPIYTISPNTLRRPNPYNYLYPSKDHDPYIHHQIGGTQDPPHMYTCIHLCIEIFTITTDWGWIKTARLRDFQPSTT